jgi:hypothetical protein
MFGSEKSMEQRPGKPGTQGVQRTRLWRQVRTFAPVRVVRMSDAKQSAAVTVPSTPKAVWQARIWAWFRTLTKRLLLANAWQASGKVFRQVTLATGVWIAHATGVEEETGMTWADDEEVSIEAPGPERPGVDAASDGAAGDDAVDDDAVDDDAVDDDIVSDNAADDDATRDAAGREDDGELGRPSLDALGVGVVGWEDAEAPADTKGVAETGERWIGCEEGETTADSNTLELGLPRVLVDRGLPRASVCDVPAIWPVDDSATETELPKGSVWKGTFREPIANEPDIEAADNDVMGVELPRILAPIGAFRESIADEPDIKAADNDVMRVELPLISIEVANADPVESNELAVDA